MSRSNRGVSSRDKSYPKSHGFDLKEVEMRVKESFEDPILHRQELLKLACIGTLRCNVLSSDGEYTCIEKMCCFTFDVEDIPDS